MIRAALLGLLGVQAARAARPAPHHAVAIACEGPHTAAEASALSELGRQIRKAEVVRDRLGRALADNAERTDRALGEVLDVQRGDDA